MFRIRLWLGFCLLLTVTSRLYSQQMTAASVATAVPHLVNFSGLALGPDGKPLAGPMGVTFLLYKDEQGGAPLWLETQTVQPDRNGHYSAQLGATKTDGLPMDLFASGEARWLAVSINGGPEQPRVLLLSVPYALKAGDAQTLGGLPPSAFMLAPQPGSSSAMTSAQSPAVVSTATPPPPSGTLDFIPMFTDNNGTLGNSAMFQTGTGSTARVGVNTITPASTFDVKGTTTLHGPLTLSAVGAATATAGKNSQSQNLTSSSFNSGTAAAVNQTFRWQAEPSGNNTLTPSATLNLLFGSGTTSPTETGLKIANNGQITFPAGQTFPGAVTSLSATAPLSANVTSAGLASIQLNGCANGQILQWNASAWTCITGGTGTITGVSAGADLTGGGTSGAITLSLDTTKVPQLKTANTFVGNQSVTGNLSATGSITGASAVLSGSSSGPIGQVTQNSPGTALLVQQNDAGSSISDVGIAATAAGSQAIAIKAISTSAAGSPTAVYGSVASPSAVAAVFDNSASNGEIFSLRNNGAEKMSVDVFGDLDLNGGQLIVQSGPVPAVLNATGGGTIFIGESKGVQKFAVDGSGNVSAAGAVSASTFTGNGAGLTGIPQLSTSNTFSGNQTVQGSLFVGNTAAPVVSQLYGKDSSGTGIQSQIYNLATTGDSYAVYAATSNGITSEMATDGLGTGPMGTPGAYFGTYTNQPIGFITGNAARMSIDTAGNVNINNRIASYNGTQTAGNGLVPIVGAIRQTGLTGTTRLTLFTPASDGLFRLSIYAVCTNSSGSIQAALIFQEPTMSIGISVYIKDESGNIALNCPDDYGQRTLVVRSKGGVPLEVFVAPNAGSPVFDFMATVEQLM